jgi:hypothetical protein
MDLNNLHLEFQKATGAALIIGKWWKFACFPFCPGTKPPVLKKFYYQTVEIYLIFSYFQ